AVLCGNLIESPRSLARSGTTAVSTEVISLMDIPWYLRIGQLAHKEKNKTLVFLLDEQGLAYLDVLKSKDNLTVISLDENDISGVRDHMKNLYVNSKLSVGLSREAECNY